jgi:hypothetical protein
MNNYDLFGAASGVKSRRKWTAEQKAEILDQLKNPSNNLMEVAERYNVSASLICNWRRKTQHMAAAAHSYVIDKAVPLPVQNTRNRVSFPWAEMKQGDSFFAAGYVGRNSQREGKVMSTVTARKIHPGSSWVVREEAKDGVWGVRVWRSA